MVDETIAWLDKHRTGQEITDTIRDLWRHSSLVLRRWAERIDRIEPWMIAEGVRLAVCLAGETDVFAWQAIPLSDEHARWRTNKYAYLLPEAVLELAGVAPGLSIHGQGSLVEPAFLATRLGYVQSWGSSEDRQRVEKSGFASPDLTKHLIEIASNGIGDCYVLGVAGGVYFFDHEAGGLIECTVGLNGLISTYLENPESIIDPYGRAWAIRPEEDKEQDSENEPLSHVLSRSEKTLSNLAAIAVSVRTCHRALPGQWIPPLSSYWREFEQAINPILRRIQRVAVSGHACEEGWASQSLEVIKEVESKYAPSNRPEGCGYIGVLLASDAIPSLIKACTQPDDRETARETVFICSTSLVIIGREDVLLRMQAAAIADVDRVQLMNLGVPGTIGKPVPAEFFDRPLWPIDQRPHGPAEYQQ